MGKLFFLLLITSLTFAQDSTSVNDPCKDPQLLRLEHKENLSEAEMKMYVELRKLCDDKSKGDYGPAKQKSKSEVQVNKEKENKTDIRDAQTSALKAYTFYVVIAAIALIVSMIYLLSL